MTGKDLLEAMGHVDGRFVEEAEFAAIPKRRVSPWVRTASVAACLAVLCLAVFAPRPGLEATEGGSANDIIAEGGVESHQKAESQSYGHENQNTAEVPAVILYVEEITDSGFTGTVAQLVDTDIFETGMELQVILPEDVHFEIPEEDVLKTESARLEHTGCYVMVQFTEYDAEAGTVVADLLREADMPEDP